MRRRSIVSTLLVILAAASAASRAEVVVEPAQPTAATPVTMIVRPNGDETCLLWRVSSRNDFSITLAGSSVPASIGCDYDQSLPVGTLAVGRYHVEARRADDTVWGEVYFTVTATPTAQSAEEVAVRPARPTTVDPIDVVVSVQDNGCVSVWGVHDVAIAGDLVTITLDVSYFPILCPPTPTRQHGFRVHLPPLAAGLKTLVVEGFGLQRHFTVETASATARLIDRFEAHLSWTDPNGEAHDARPVALSNGSAVYSFSDPANVELTVKALDGRPVNGKFWIFAASLTDQPWELTVVDRGSAGCDSGHCAQRVYRGVAHQNANVLDTQAFNP